MFPLGFFYFFIFEAGLKLMTLSASQVAGLQVCANCSVSFEKRHKELGLLLEAIGREEKKAFRLLSRVKAILGGWGAQTQGIEI